MPNLLFDFLENTLTPIAGKLGTQRHVCAIRDGFIGAMPFMIVGSFLLVFAFPPFSADTTLAFGQWWLSLSKQYAHEILTPFNMSMGIMSCYICTCIAYNLAHSYKLDALPTSMLGLMTFLLVCSPMDDNKLSAAYMGGAGIFTAVIVAIYVTEVTRYLKKKNIGIKMPEQVPDKIRQSFNLLIPAIVVICTIYPLNLFIEHEFGMLLPGAIMAAFKPLISASDTLPAILLAVFLAQVLWFAGIHGAAIVTGIMEPFFLYNLGLNQKALAAGLPMTHIFTDAFWGVFIVLGGSGATLALVIMFMRSKSVHLKTIGRLGIIPSIFNINEPIIFGSPIVMNPTLFVPFVLAPMFNATVAYFATTTGFIGHVVSLITWTTPAPIGGAWATGWQLNTALLVIGLIICDMVIYYPFFKVYEKQLVEEENRNKEENAGEPDFA